MIRAQIQKDGYLKITADNEGRFVLRQCLENSDYYNAQGVVGSYIWRQGFHFVKPEDVGALTSSPILKGPDDDIWWFPNYQIQNEWEALKNTGRVIFDPEENNKSLPKKAINA